MEYIDGTDLKTYLQGNPGAIDQLFLQTIAAFKHLEEKRILHRDIRPSNIMVSNDGVVKVIDFGFGKQIDSSDSFGKSITLNWAASEPKEFEDGKYDFCTECYFVGKLFQTITKDLGISDFSYADVVKAMTEYDPADRIKSFSEVSTATLTEAASTDRFSEEDRQVYRRIADFVVAAIQEFSKPVTFEQDSDKVLQSLKAVETASQLETVLQNANPLIKSLVTCEFTSRFVENKLRIDDLTQFVNFFSGAAGRGKANSAFEFVDSIPHHPICGSERYSILTIRNVGLVETGLQSPQFYRTT